MDAIAKYKIAIYTNLLSLLCYSTPPNNLLISSSQLWTGHHLFFYGCPGMPVDHILRPHLFNPLRFVSFLFCYSLIYIFKSFLHPYPLISYFLHSHSHHTSFYSSLGTRILYVNYFRHNSNCP